GRHRQRPLEVAVAPLDDLYGFGYGYGYYGFGETGTVVRDEGAAAATGINGKALDGVAEPQLPVPTPTVGRGRRGR
ncbi:MAG: hypothetical protein M3471_04825, partial [Actinomycetota bacterium]|nr:hypothetical protein [Actinomycetota bacterium]